MDKIPTGQLRDASQTPISFWRAQPISAGLDALERGRAASGSIAYAVPKKSRATVEEDELGMMDLLPGARSRRGPA